MNRTGAALAILIATVGVSFGGQQGGKPIAVEPGELQRRADLVGREIQVDDRVAYYVPRTGAEDDELQLKRTPITFRVPRRLRPTNHLRMPAVVVQGTLEREGSRLFCRVTSIDPKSADLERLKAALDQLSPRDYETRRAWARWAERRAAEFRDDALMGRAKALEAEVLRMEGEMKRVAVDAPQEWLTMARDARRRRVPEPEPSALAHRALRARLASASDRQALESLAREVESFFPEAATAKDAGRANLARWEPRYADDPAEAYRSAPLDIRKALDRRLWADVQQRLMESEPIPELAMGVALADRAADRLPERPDLSTRLLDKAIDVARRELPSLRLDDAKNLAEIYRARLHRPEESQQVLRDWLENRRSRLSETDAEGRVALAGLYEDLIRDRVTAVELLRKAWTIDPTSKETADAFRNRGFLLRKDQWVEADAPSPAGPSGDGSNRARPAASSSPSLIGLTPEELQQKLIAKPSFKNYVAAKGQLIEQRVYLDTTTVRYVNLLHTPGELKPRVIADYTLPLRDRKGGPHPAR